MHQHQHQPEARGQGKPISETDHIWHTLWFFSTLSRWNISVMETDKERPRSGLFFQKIKIPKKIIKSALKFNSDRDTTQIVWDIFDNLISFDNFRVKDLTLGNSVTQTRIWLIFLNNKNPKKNHKKWIKNQWNLLLLLLLPPCTRLHCFFKQLFRNFLGILTF